jgi:hypothetical protein
MRAAAAALALLALVVAGCGSDRNAARRSSVDAYLRKVDAIEQDAAPALQRANVAFNAFWRKQRAPREDARLRDAAATIRSVDLRVRRLKPPPDARGLHGRLVRLCDAQSGFAVQVRQLGAFLPAMTLPLAHLDRANASLREQLGKAGSANIQAAVLHHYVPVVDANVAALARLTPPPLLARWHTANVARLRATAATGRELERRLRGTDPGLAQLAGWRFRKAVAASAETPRLLRAALLAYNARIRRISTLAADVQRERTRLQRRLQ